jgi:hypothetical protein
MIIITVFNNILLQIFIVVSLIIFSSLNELKSLEEGRESFSLGFSHENCCSLPVETFAIVFFSVPFWLFFGGEIGLSLGLFYFEIYRDVDELKLDSNLQILRNS